jgi:site-specific recombinase XerD
MIDDMAIRNMSPLTQKAYVRAVKNFSLHFRRSPDALTFEDVRDYQLHLVSRGLEATTINQIMCALRFLYGTTLGKKDAGIKKEGDKLVYTSAAAPFAGDGKMSVVSLVWEKVK